MSLKQSNRFFCFSPPVMLATFLFEITLLIFVLVKHSLKTPVSRIVSVMLVCLAVFQLAEYNVCGRLNIDAVAWSKIGFIAITLLPPLGVHLVQVLIGTKNKTISLLAYASSAWFIYMFGFNSGAFQSHVCAGNYAIFQLAENFGGWYYIYYYFWLFVAVAMAWFGARKSKPHHALALKYLIAGYAFFLIPTAIVNTVKPETQAGIPSVMCGFAVVFAIVLVFGILPAGSATKQASKSKRLTK